MAELISLAKSPEAALLRAQEQLRAGGVVAIPTDTVYGLAARAADQTAVAKLSSLKQRSASIPIAVLVANISQALELAGQPSQSARQLLQAARLLMEHFWPGPLTLALPVGSAQQETIGVRCPAHDWVRRLASAVGPLATTSANLHGRDPCLTAEEIEAAFGNLPGSAGAGLADAGSAGAGPAGKDLPAPGSAGVGLRGAGLAGAGPAGKDLPALGSATLDLIIDGGRLNSPASTVVGWENGRLVVFREGSITKAQLHETLASQSPN